MTAPIRIEAQHRLPVSVHDGFECITDPNTRDVRTAERAKESHLPTLGCQALPVLKKLGLQGFCGCLGASWFVWCGWVGQNRRVRDTVVDTAFQRLSGREGANPGHKATPRPSIVSPSSLARSMEAPRSHVGRAAADAELHAHAAAAASHPSRGTRGCSETATARLLGP